MSKYDALRDHLRGVHHEVRYSITEISKIVPGGLPRSAFRWEAWWANEDPTHSHCRSWGDAGFTAHPDLAGQRVGFVPK